MKPWGALYLVTPDWTGADAGFDETVVEAFEPAQSFLFVAPELWRLAGNETFMPVDIAGRESANALAE